MRIGDLVVCIEEKQAITDPICTPIKKGNKYRVLAVRDANLRPPKNIDAPHEIMIVPGTTDIDKLGWYCSARYFRKVENESTEANSSR